MYNSMNDVLEGRVFIGNLSAAQSDEMRSEFGITHVLSVCPDSVSAGQNHLTIPIEDEDDANILIYLPIACQFIQTSLDEGGKVLVHCYAGISRSATVVCAYIMSTQHLSFDAALEYIRRSRGWASPNPGFRQQLSVFECCSYQPSFTNQVYRTWNSSRTRSREKCFVPFQYISLLIPIIPDKLFVCYESTGKQVTMMTNVGITHVLSITPCALEYQGPSIVEHKLMNSKENDFSWYGDILSTFPEACQFIHNGIESGGKVLIHSGVSFRLKSFLCAYLVFSQGSLQLPSRAYGNVDKFPFLPMMDNEIFSPESLRSLEFFDACVETKTDYHFSIRDWSQERSYNITT